MRVERVSAKFLLLLLTPIFAQAQLGGNKGGVDPATTGQPYVLGPGDQIMIHATNAEELSEKPFRIETDGTLDLPLVGRMHPGGEPVERFEAELIAKLNEYVRDPRVNVTVSQPRNQRVTFAGAFKSPGVYNLEGRHTLTEMLAISGGLLPEASRVLTIARVNASAIPAGTVLTTAERTPGDGQPLILKLDITGSKGQSRADDFSLEPLDVVTAVIGEPVIVQGEVQKVGPISLEDRHSLSLIQVLAMCGGITHDASLKIRIYRPVGEQDHKQLISVNLEKVIKGEEKDPGVLPRDIVLVPRNTGKAMTERVAAVAASIAIAAGSGLAIAH